MRKIFQSSAVAVILLMTATFAFSQQRITFKRGAKQATVTGNLNSYRGKKVFVIRVRRGQTLSTEQVKPDASNRYITVSIKAPNGGIVGDSDASCNNRKEISPTRSGDYRIEVYECQKADAWRGTFRLKVRVD
ncbi:MAG TPA: hypothetical protein VNB22_17055 [Pyrinomonadaceae bacterium]|jgi:hypothetical protein|nr:hypothetical protein [Pyrinomonadaceae bacterium]